MSDWGTLRDKLRAEKHRLEKDPKTKFAHSKALESLGRVCGVAKNPGEDDQSFFARIKRTPEFGKVEEEMWEKRFGDGVVDFMKELKKL